MARMRRADPSGPGIERRRHGRGFTYRDEDGLRVTEPEVLLRIGELVIPPAWQDVWICPYPMGHLQAVGTDAAGRRQYLYHPEWRRRRDQAKFDEMISFAGALPPLRERVAADLQGETELTRERVLACAVRLLDRGFFRIGSEDYAERNESYGLATVRKEHVSLGDGFELSFDFPAKSGQRTVREVTDEVTYEIVGRLKRRRGGSPELLAYRRGGRWVDLRSPDVNAYIKEVTGADYSAKDFRTWNATMLAAVALAVSAHSAGTRTGRKGAISRAVKEVARYLGNTPAVARASYIDPRVFDAFQSGVTIAGVIGEIGLVSAPGEPPTHQREVHEAVLDLLEERHDSDAIEQVPAAA